MKRFDVAYVDFPSYDNESVQSGLRPAIICSNDMCNKFSSIVTVIPFTSRQKRQLPTHLTLDNNEAQRIGLKGESTLLAEQITTASQSRIQKIIGHVTDPIIQAAITEKTDIQLGKITQNDVLLNHVMEMIIFLQKMGINNLEDAQRMMLGAKR